MSRIRSGISGDKHSRKCPKEFLEHVKDEKLRHKHFNDFCISLAKDSDEWKEFTEEKAIIPGLTTPKIRNKIRLSMSTNHFLCTQCFLRFES